MQNNVYLRYMQLMTLESVKKDVEFCNVPYTLRCGRVYMSYCPDYGMDLCCSAGKWIASFGGE